MNRLTQQKNKRRKSHISLKLGNFRPNRKLATIDHLLKSKTYRNRSLTQHKQALKPINSKLLHILHSQSNPKLGPEARSKSQTRDALTSFENVFNQQPTSSWPAMEAAVQPFSQPACQPSPLQIKSSPESKTPQAASLVQPASQQATTQYASQASAACSVQIFLCFGIVFCARAQYFVGEQTLGARKP